MLLSHRCTYALRLALALVEAAPDAYVPVREISDRLGTPAAFLSKTAQALVAAGLLTGRRGVGGGVALARQAEQIALLDVVLAIDGPDVLATCILGLTDCGIAAPCPLHDAWTSARGDLRQRLADTTLADAARQLGPGGERITG